MDIIIGNVVDVQALPCACQRTKNRIREHGPLFEVTGFDPGSWLFGNTPAVMLESKSKTASDGTGGKETWKGWLPVLAIGEKNDT